MANKLTPDIGDTKLEHDGTTLQYTKDGWVRVIVGPRGNDGADGVMGATGVSGADAVVGNHTEIDVTRRIEMRLLVRKKFINFDKKNYTKTYVMQYRHRKSMNDYWSLWEDAPTVEEEVI